jgi:hypothetical protein
MTDPITMQRQLADKLNATLETSDAQNLAQNASLDNVELDENVSTPRLSKNDIIAFDELQSRLQADAKPVDEPQQEKSHQPILIAIFMFALAAIVIGGEYLL